MKSIIVLIVIILFTYCSTPKNKEVAQVTPMDPLEQLDLELDELINNIKSRATTKEEKAALAALLTLKGALKVGSSIDFALYCISFAENELERLQKPKFDQNLLVPDLDSLKRY